MDHRSIRGEDRFMRKEQCCHCIEFRLSVGSNKLLPLGRKLGLTWVQDRTKSIYFSLFCLFVIYLFEQVEVLAAIQLMWTCYTHPPIYTQRTATTPGTSSPTLHE